MKYSIIFAGAASAHYAASSSAVYEAATTSAPSYVTVRDYDHKPVVITRSDQNVCIYHEKKTKTYSPTVVYGAAKPTGTGYSHAAPSAVTEVYEKIEYAPFNKLGPHAFNGYSGVDTCEQAKTEQVAVVEEYKGGKWYTSTVTHSYGMPTAYATTYAPGTYTVPAKTVTVDSTMYLAAEATHTASAGETCTYGGRYIQASQTGVMTVPYAAYETSSSSVYPVIKTSTVTVTSTGKYEVCKPTVVVASKATEYPYPSAAYYKPGVYMHDEKVVVVTKSSEAITCDYTKTKAYEQKTVYEPAAYSATNVPVAPEHYSAAYGYEASSVAPYATGAAYATGYPAAASSTPCTEEYETAATATPYKAAEYPAKASVAAYKASPVHAEYPAQSSPCEEEIEAEYKKAHATPYAAAAPSKAVYTPVYAANYAAQSSPAAYNPYPAKPVVASEYKPEYTAAAYPVKNEKPSAVYPVAPAETSPCEESKIGYVAKPTSY